MDESSAISKSVEERIDHSRTRLFRQTISWNESSRENPILDDSSTSGRLYQQYQASKV